MIRYSQALTVLLNAAKERGLTSKERIQASESLGRVTASPIFSAEALPAFDNSSMDGYAVVADKTFHASPATPARFEILGSISAGDRPFKVFASKEGVYEIMTGAPLPPGFDAVVKVEDTRSVKGGKVVELLSPAQPGDYVRKRGRDFNFDEKIVDVGTLIEERHLMAFAALGVTHLSVRKKPKVCVISTGSELVRPGCKPRPGQIRNATAGYLSEALTRMGAEVESCHSMGDKPKDFIRLMKRALKTRPDVIVTTGAVSKGRHDFVAAAVGGLGGKTLFHQVAIRPGKPGFSAILPNGALFLGMPGNPISTIVAARFFVEPVLRRLLGRPVERGISARLEEEVSKPQGLRCFFKAKLKISPAGNTVRVLSGQASFQIRPLLDANAWVVLTEEGDRVSAGTQAAVFPLMSGRWDWEEATPRARHRHDGMHRGRKLAQGCC